MAKISIEIEDLPQNRVKVTCVPTFETMMMMVQSGSDLESSHGLAIAALNLFRDISKASEPTNTIYVPKIGK